MKDHKLAMVDKVQAPKELLFNPKGFSLIRVLFYPKGCSLFQKSRFYPKWVLLNQGSIQIVSQARLSSFLFLGGRGKKESGQTVGIF